jgi:multiple sugar transport system permease protein
MTDLAHDAHSPGAGPIPSLARHVVLCIVSIAMLYPLLWMLASSFKPEDDIFSNASLFGSHLDLDAYRRGWSGLQVSFGRFFINSAIIAIASVAGNVLTCSLAAYAFARLRFRGRNFCFALMLGTLMLPYQVTLNTCCSCSSIGSIPSCPS